VVFRRVELFLPIFNTDGIQLIQIPKIMVQTVCAFLQTGHFAKSKPSEGWQPSEG